VSRPDVQGAAPRSVDPAVVRPQDLDTRLRADRSSRRVVLLSFGSALVWLLQAIAPTVSSIGVCGSTRCWQ